MDLTVLVDGYDPHHGLGLAVAGEQHRARPHPLGRMASERVDQPRPSSSWASRSATRSRAFIGAPRFGSALVIRVHPGAVLATSQLVDAGVKVVEGHGEVPRVPAGGLQAEASGPENADSYQGRRLDG